MKVSLIDSHVHLNDDSIYQRLEEVITAAVNVGVDQFICIGYDRFHSERALSIANEFDSVYAAVGFHPASAHEIGDLELNWLRERAKKSCRNRRNRARLLLGQEPNRGPKKSFHRTN